MLDLKQNKTKEDENILCPDVVITDFDRTLAYLYIDNGLLLKLAKIISDYYSEFLKVEQSFYERDGYYAWYELHKKVCESYDKEKALEINEKAEKLVTEFEREVVKKIPLFDGTEENVKKLAKMKVPLAIVSSNAPSAIKDELEKYGIENLFCEIVGREIPFNPENLKPSPHQINLCKEKMHIKDEIVWYVGDDTVDMLSANRAGVVAVGVETGRYKKEVLYKSGADVCFPSFNDVVSYIEKHHK